MLDLKFVNGLIPVIVQDAESKDVLMMAWANDEAVRLTQQTGLAHYYSRSRKKLWKKGRNGGGHPGIRSRESVREERALKFFSVCMEIYESSHPPMGVARPPRLGLAGQITGS